MKELTKYSNSNEFFYRVPPGQLQYEESLDDLMDLNTDIETLSYDDGWVIEDPNPEILKRLTPDTLKGRKKWEIIVVIKKEVGNLIIYKGALLNKTTNDTIGLLTTFNSKEHIIEKSERAIKSKSPGWYVGHYRMLAPLIFWHELKMRLTQ